MFELRCSVSELGCSDVDMFQRLRLRRSWAKHVWQITTHPADQNGERCAFLQAGEIDLRRAHHWVGDVDEIVFAEAEPVEQSWSEDARIVGDERAIQVPCF